MSKQKLTHSPAKYVKEEWNEQIARTLNDEVSNRKI